MNISDWIFEIICLRFEFGRKFFLPNPADHKNLQLKKFINGFIQPAGFYNDLFQSESN